MLPAYRFWTARQVEIYLLVALRTSRSYNPKGTNRMFLVSPVQSPRGPSHVQQCQRIQSIRGIKAKPTNGEPVDDDVFNDRFRGVLSFDHVCLVGSCNLQRRE